MQIDWHNACRCTRDEHVANLLIILHTLEPRITTRKQGWEERHIADTTAIDLTNGYLLHTTLKPKLLILNQYFLDTLSTLGTDVSIFASWTNYSAVF